MPASDPIGGQKFWVNGLPFSQVKSGGNVTGGQKFWVNGLPVQGLFLENELTPGTGGLIFSIFVPEVMVNEHNTINISVRDLVFSTSSPEMVVDYIREPSGNNLSFSTFIPVVVEPINLIINNKNLVFSTYSPEVNYTNVGPEIPRSIRIAGNSGNEIILIEIDLWRS